MEQTQKKSARESPIENRRAVKKKKKKKRFNSRLLALTISICGFATFVPLKSRGGSMLPGEYVPRAKGSKGTSLKKVSFRTRDERTIVPAVTNFAQRNDSSPFWSGDKTRRRSNKRDWKNKSNI